MTDHQLLTSLKKVQENIEVTMAELSSLKEEMYAQSQKEERSKVFKFIDDVKRAGFTTDLSTIEGVIQRKFSLSTHKVMTHLIDYIEFTSNQNNTPIPVVQPVVQPVIQPVKRKGPKPYSEMTPEELIVAKASKTNKNSKVQKPEPLVLNTTLPEITGLQQVNGVEELASPAMVVNSDLTEPVKEKRVLGVKKISDASKIWYSFVKTVQAEMETTGEKVKYEDILKKAKEMKDGDKEGYKLFSSTWTPDDQIPSN